MSRLIFFLLLVAALALGAHLWLSEQAQKSDFSMRERNAEAVTIVAVVPPTVAALAAEESRRTRQGLAGAACVEFSGIGAADVARARKAFAALELGERLSERRVDEISRYWVHIPSAPDRRTAEATIAQLRRLGVDDLSIRSDNAISLGVFSTQEAARRFLASLEARGVRGAEEGPFLKEMREIVMLIREPDSELVSRLAVLQRDFPGAQLRAVPCQ